MQQHQQPALLIGCGFCGHGNEFPWDEIMESAPESIAVAVNAHAALVAALEAVYADLRTGFIANDSARADAMRSRHERCIEAALKLAKPLAPEGKG